VAISLLTFFAKAHAYDPLLMVYGGKHDWEKLDERIYVLMEEGDVHHEIDALIAQIHHGYVTFDLVEIHLCLRDLDKILREVVEK
jgi:hypothetical protein